MGISQQIGASSLIRPGVIDNTAARPASPYEGQVIFQKDTDQLLVWNGTAWVIPNQTTQNPEGLDLVKSQTVGTAVSSIVVTDAFSSTYDNYLVKFSGGTQSDSVDIKMNLGSSVTGYYGFLTYGDTSSSAIAGANTSNQTYFAWIGGGLSGQASHAQFELLNPFLSIYTKIRNASYQNTNGYGTMQGEHRVASSYTGFTITPGSGTLTGGTVRVYGYRNS